MAQVEKELEEAQDSTHRTKIEETEHMQTEHMVDKEVDINDGGSEA